MTYIEIVFMQDSGANEALAILDESGPQALLDHLKQWDNLDGGGFASTREPQGTADSVFINDGYHLSYNTRIGYCGLCKIEDQ